MTTIEFYRLLACNPSLAIDSTSKKKIVSLDMRMVMNAPTRTSGLEGTTRKHLMRWAANGKKDGAAPFEEDGCDTFVTDTVAACTIATARPGNMTELTRRSWVCGSRSLGLRVEKNSVYTYGGGFVPPYRYHAHAWYWAGDQKPHLVWLFLFFFHSTVRITPCLLKLGDTT